MDDKIVRGALTTALAAAARTSDPAGAAQSGAADSVPDRLQEALAKLDELNQALASSREDSHAARQRSYGLADIISHLRQDVIRLEREVAELRHFAYHDELTGLPNRSLLLDRLNQAIVQAARQQKHVGVLLLDLDGFKGVNDRFGHAIGDKLLQELAQRLLASIRNADTACRYGGDEFLILLPDVDGENSVAEVAQKISAHLAKPYAVSNPPLIVTASIGVAVYPWDGRCENDLIRQADTDMYLAKSRNDATLRTLQLERGK